MMQGRNVVHERRLAIARPRCFERECVNFQGVRNKGDESTEWPFCTAFPNGIPEEIAYGKELHLGPFPGDNGIMFEKDGD